MNKNRKKKTALVLSGGGSRGAYQMGVWRALTELGWTFDMVVGVSVGSLNGTMVVQDEQILAETLWRELETDNIFDVSNDAQPGDFAMEFLRQGGAGSKGLRSFVEKYVDEERIRESEIDFGIVTVEFPAMKPRYLWKKDIPEGQIGDFVMASSSAYPAVQPYEIDGVKYIDGGYEDVLPIHMAVKNGATDIVAVYLRAVGMFNKNKEFQSAQNARLTFIQPRWELGNFLLFDKANTARIIRLGYQDAMKEFGVYDGEFYTFIKGEIPKAQLKGADAAAKVFELDPMILYSEETLLESLSLAVESSKKEFGNLLKMGKSVVGTFAGSATETAKPDFTSHTLPDLDTKHEQGEGGIPVKTGPDLKSIVETIRNVYTGDPNKRLTAEALFNTNKRIATLVIANDIKQRGPNSIFLNRYALKIARDEILAARYIQAKELI